MVFDGKFRVLNVLSAGSECEDFEGRTCLDQRVKPLRPLLQCVRAGLVARAHGALRCLDRDIPTWNIWRYLLEPGVDWLEGRQEINQSEPTRPA